MFSLATLRTSNGPTAALCIEGQYWAIADVAPHLLQPLPERGLMAIFDAWESAEPVLVQVWKAITSGELKKAPLPAPAGAEDVLTPLQFPRKLVMVGANYVDHMRIDARRDSYKKEDHDPVFFLKPPSTALVGGGKTAEYPPRTLKFDYEIELAAVIGKRARHLTLENAMEYVAGYTIAIDFSARDLQRNPRHMANFDLFAGKCFDSGCPVGPGITPARFIKHNDLPLKLWVNGELRQDSNSNNMIWSLEEQLVGISELLTLEPGDILSTGTPAGTGLKDQRFLKVGDTVDAEIGPLGRLSVEVVQGK